MVWLSKVRVWKWLRLLGRNFASWPILLTLLIWYISCSWWLEYHVANTASFVIRPYAYVVGTGVNAGTTTEFYSIKHINEMNFTFSILNQPQSIGNPNGHVVTIPFWLIIAVFSPFAFLQWRRTYLDRRLPGHCPTCHYDLTGNTTGVCPECGGKVKTDVIASASPTQRA